MHRQRREATACTSCRNRRVRCDRMRPVCHQCTKRAGQICEYIGPSPSRIEFVTEPLSSALAAPSAPVVPAETWKTVLEAQTAAQESSGSREGVLALVDHAVEIRSLGEPFLSTLFGCLAPRETYLPYFENYLLTVHPLMPIYPISTLRVIYTAFWDGLSLSTSAELLVLILGMLYTGAANGSSLQDRRDSEIIHEIYHKLIVALDLSTYHVVSSTRSLWLLHGIVIMNTFRISHLTPFTAFGFLPFAIRFAQSLRLHIFQEGNTSTHSEPCRRLWCHLIFLDVESTIASGLQCIIRSQGHTTQLPSLETDVPGRGELSPTPMALAMQGHWELAHRMHTWLERKPEQHELIHFGRIIEQLLKAIPDHVQSEWARIYLRMLVDRAYCMLGLRFWQLEQFKGTDCHSEVVRTSRSFLKNYVRLAEISTERGFSWFIPGLIQPIHGLMILLMHLSGCTKQDDESVLSRDLIEQVFRWRVNGIPNGAMTHLASNDEPSLIQLNNPRYRALSALRIRVSRKFKWPIVVTPNPQIYEVPSCEESALETDVDSLQAANMESGGQIWGNWDTIESGVPSESSSWDDWGPFMPNFFADESCG